MEDRRVIVNQSTYVAQPGCGCGCITIPAAIFTFVLVVAGWVVLGALAVSVVLVLAVVAVVARVVNWAATRNGPRR